MTSEDRVQTVPVLPRITVSVVVLRADQVLLTKREDFEVWCVPSGHVELGESVEDAARRETLEETGHMVELDRFVGVYSTIGDWPDMHSCTFTGRCVTEAPSDLSTPDEVLDVHWFDARSLPAPMMWWQERRIGDAVAGLEGMVVTERVRSRLGRWERMELYQARDQSGMSRSAFFEWNFPREG